jgi:hypothetical protein
MFDKNSYFINFPPPPPPIEYFCSSGLGKLRRFRKNEVEETGISVLVLWRSKIVLFLEHIICDVGGSDLCIVTVEIIFVYEAVAI